MKIPHVSDVVKILVDPTWFTDKSRDRGLRVHGKVAAYLLGGWSPKLPDNEQGYYDSFMLWANQFLQRIEPYSVERRIDDKEYGFCGTPDFIGPVAMCESVIDWKTPLNKYRAWEIAGAAYFRLAKNAGWPVKRVGNLQLSPDGKMPRMNWIPDPEKKFWVFLSCLNIWRFLNQ